MKVGFIGLGIMGRPMAKNVRKAGYDLIVNTLEQKTIDEFVALGAESAKSAAEIASKVDVIITMLPNSPQVRDVCLGKGGIIETATDKTVVIESIRGFDGLVKYLLTTLFLSNKFLNKAFLYSESVFNFSISSPK